MAGVPSNPMANKPGQIGSWLEQLLNTFPDWAAQQGIEPPSARDEQMMGTPINTIGQPRGTPPMSGLDVVPDAGRATGIPGPGINMSKDQSRAIGTESTNPDNKRNNTGVPQPMDQRGRMIYDAPIGPSIDDWIQTLGPEADMDTPQVQPQPQAQIQQPQVPGVPAPTPQANDMIPPSVDPIMGPGGVPDPTLDPTPPAVGGNALQSALGLIELMAPPQLQAPAAPAPPPIRPVDSKLMEVLAMGMRSGEAGAGQLSPFFNLLGKG